jgi:hypothetical protein
MLALEEKSVECWEKTGRRIALLHSARMEMKA